MADTRKIVRVFLASPGDLAEEREAARAVVAEFNRLWASRLGYQVELVRWEDAVSRSGRPQAILNEDLERCELFVGMLWQKWGMPPDHGGPYTSGFEEEFRESIKRRTRTGRPEIKMLFKDIERSRLDDPGPDLEKVLSFKKELVDSRIVLFEGFSSITDFRSRLLGCITNYVQILQDEELKGNETQEGGSTDEPSNLSVPETPSEEPALTVEGVSFLRSLIQRAKSPEAIAPVEAARLRLLGHAIGTSSNDEDPLGVHDANLIFRKRTTLDLSMLEKRQLAIAGLCHLGGENCPVWRWLVESEILKSDTLTSYSLEGRPPSRRTGTIKAMRLLAMPLPTKGQIPREDYVGSWLSPKTPSPLKNAALSYLGEHGVEDDLKLIRDELSKNDYQTRASATEALVRILARKSRSEALATLFEVQPDTLSQVALDALFDEREPFLPEQLRPGLEQRSSIIRKACLKALRAQDALSASDAEKLLGDEDAEIRFEALTEVTKHRDDLSLNEARKILIKPTGSVLLSPFARTDYRGMDLLQRYKRMRLEALSNAELRDQSHLSSGRDLAAYFALARRNFGDHAVELRARLADGFREFLRDELAAMAGNRSSTEELRESADAICGELVREGLEVICQKGDKSDLALVREILVNPAVLPREAHFSYLRRYGEWQDIELIVDLAARRDRNTSLLTFGSEDWSGPASAALYRIGSSEFQELLNKALPPNLLDKVLIEAPDATFNELSNETLNRLFFDENVSIRRTAALKALRALSKTRLSALLNSYINSKRSRYYNVIHWLDLAQSFPIKRAREIAHRALYEVR